MINLKIKNSGNEMKYVVLLRKHTPYSIAEIKSRLQQEYTLSADLSDIDELKKLRDLKNLLIEAGAEIQIYEDDYEVVPKFLDNIIEADEETRKHFEELDELTGDWH